MTRNNKDHGKFKQARSLVSAVPSVVRSGVPNGLLFLIPLTGIGIGTFLSALSGKFGDIGINDEFM